MRTPRNGQEIIDIQTLEACKGDWLIALLFRSAPLKLTEIPLNYVRRVLRLRQIPCLLNQVQKMERAMKDRRLQHIRHEVDGTE